MSDAPSRRDQGSLCPKRPSRRYASDRQKPWRRLPSTLFRDALRQSNQIVGGGSEGEGPPDAAATAELRLLLPGHRLDPAERLFDPLADALTDGIGPVARRACVPPRTSATGVLRHMRRHCHRAQLIDEVFRVVGLVGTERDRARPVGARFDHGERRYPLGMAVSRRQTSINQKAMVVLHQAMADEAELGFLAWSLAVEPCIGIRRRDMRLVRPLLSMEIGFGIAPATGRRLVRSVPWLKALQRSPRFDQRPVDREVVGG